MANIFVVGNYAAVAANMLNLDFVRQPSLVKYLKLWF